MGASITFGPDGSVIDEKPPTVEDVNADTIRAQAQTALANNRTYLALGTPTAAQNTAQVKALTRQTQGIIRLLLGALDGTD